MAHEKVTLNEKYNMEILERATEVIAKEQGKKNMPQVQLPELNQEINKIDLGNAVLKL